MLGPDRGQGFVGADRKLDGDRHPREDVTASFDDSHDTRFADDSDPVDRLGAAGRAERDVRGRGVSSTRATTTLSNPAEKSLI
jgi:hypothetical protein